jgi:hypothetical protein
MMQTAVLLTVLVVAADAAFAQTMTCQEAEASLAKRTLKLPAFWIGDSKHLGEQLEKIARGDVRTIAKSPSGRPLYLVSYGEWEKVEHNANFNSAIGGQKPSAYMDKAARKKPVVYFVGPVHGHEVEGLTGLVNLIAVMETGNDLRGKPQPELRRLADQCRLLIVPSGNPDGLARFEPRSLVGMSEDICEFWSQGTWADNRIALWPDAKRLHPWTGPKIGFRGCYFDDAGVNAMHDEFFAPMSTEAPAILRVAIEEGPDLAVSLHSAGYPPALVRPAYVPLEIQSDAAQVAERYYGLLKGRGLPHQGLFTATAESGTTPESFNLTSALYHASGATPFTFECPHGLLGEKNCQVSLDQILDIQLLLYEAMLSHELQLKAKAPDGK